MKQLLSILLLNVLISCGVNTTSVQAQPPINIHKRKHKFNYEIKVRYGSEFITYYCNDFNLNVYRALDCNDKIEYLSLPTSNIIEIREAK